MITTDLLILSSLPKILLALSTDTAVEIESFKLPENFKELKGVIRKTYGKRNTR